MVACPYKFTTEHDRALIAEAVTVIGKTRAACQPRHAQRPPSGHHRMTRPWPSEITISAVAARARVHRSFVHRHPDLHAPVLKAAAGATTSPSPAATAISHRSVLAENANLHEQNRRLAQQISDLEDRLSELLGQQAFDRSGLGAPGKRRRSPGRA